MSISKSFRLSKEAAQALEDLVAAGRASSQTALIEELIRRERIKLRLAEEEARLDREWEEALQDPQFLRDHQAVISDFSGSDEETWIET